MKSISKHRFYSSWDLKSIFMSIISIGLIGLFFTSFYFPSCDSRERKSDYYNSETLGTVYSIRNIKGQFQGRTGNRTQTIAYELNYSYDINGKTFNKSEVIYDKPGNLKFIGIVETNLNKKKFTIRYVSWKPEKSYLVKKLQE